MWLQYAVVARRPNRGAWAGPKPGGIDQASRQDRIDFVETLCKAVVDASESGNRSRLVPR